MAKIKNVGLISLSIVLMAFSFAVADEVHPGLKNAIDKGDYKTAKNLKEKMYVQSVYLPAKLSVEDAEYIYGPLKGYRWILGLDPKGCNYYDNHECSPEFLDKYIAKICSGTTEFDVNACLDWMNSSSITALNRFSDLFCGNKESVKRCSLYVERLPAERQYQCLQELDLKGLVEYTKTIEIDTIVQEKIPKKECLEKWKERYAVIKSSIEYDSRYNQSRGYLNESIVCFFDGSKTKMKKCIGFLDKFSKEVQNECKNGKMTRDVRKKVKVKRPYRPYDKFLRKIRYGLDETPWFAMDELWVKKAKFVHKYLKDEAEIAQSLVDQYSSNGKFVISEAKSACLMYPTVDKFISKNYGADVISCSQILHDYPTYLDLNCEMSDSVKKIHLPVEQRYRKGDSTYLVCDDKTQKYRYMSRTEILENIAEKKYGVCSIEGERNTIFICKDSAWKFIDEVNTEGVVFEKNDIVKGILDTNLFYFKDFRDDRIYRAVKIGEQIWMAENLSYSDSVGYPGMETRSWCYKNSPDSCAMYGRYYTWAAAMDSAGTFSSNGINCGNNTGDSYRNIFCTPTYPVRGICPEGWHLPTTTEWKTLYYSTMRASSYDMQVKGFEKWPNATDKYAFSAFPAGYFSPIGFDKVDSYTYFWSASGYSYNRAYYLSLNVGDVFLDHEIPNHYGFNIRCLKDDP